jgi:hypothetical protein
MSEFSNSEILQSTGRPNVPEAISWLAEGHPTPDETDWGSILRFLVATDPNSEIELRALRRVVKEATASEVDTAKVVFNLEAIPSPEELRDCLGELRDQCADRKLSNLDPSALRRAVAKNPRVVEVLCLAVGISLNDAKDWFPGIETSRQIEVFEDFLSFIARLIAGEVAPPILGAEPARAIELILKPGGFDRIDYYLENGVPYEILLAQRLVGGPWLAHKNTTSNFPNAMAADLLSRLLTERGIDFRRATTVGGSASQRDLQQLSGIPKKQIGIVCLTGEAKPVFAIAFSSARDGGTARANGDGLLQIPSDSLPVALVLTGLGWSDRGETDRLARKFAGCLFTEKSIASLVDVVAEVAR